MVVVFCLDCEGSGRRQFDAEYDLFEIPYVRIARASGTACLVQKTGVEPSHCNRRKRTGCIGTSTFRLCVGPARSTIKSLQSSDGFAVLPERPGLLQKALYEGGIPRSMRTLVEVSQSLQTFAQVLLVLGTAHAGVAFDVLFRVIQQ